MLGPNGNRLRHWEFGNGARAVDYVYDDLYRLTSETVSDATLGNRSASWSYDAVGNRLSEVETTAAGTDTTTYSYDANDRLLTETVTGLNPDTLTYSYDNNGNTLTRIDGSGTTSYAYDSRNRLSDLNAGQTTYRYDASGIRMSETSSGLTTNYLVDPNRGYAQVVEEIFDLNSFAEVRYTYGDDLIAQHRRVDPLTTNSSTYHYDGIGSTRRLTDTNSLVTDSHAYTAFGELAGSTGFTVNDYLYTGEQFDPNLGFYYLRARYYNQAVGRFQNMDTFAGLDQFPLSMHKYAYAMNDPISETDPSGLTNLSELSTTLNIRGIQRSTPSVSTRAIAIAKRVKIWNVRTYQIVWPWHSYMYVEKIGSGSGLRYDVGVRGGWDAIFANPFRTLGGIVTARPASRGSLRGVSVPLAKFTFAQQLLWHQTVVGTHESSCAIDYNVIKGPNCTTWTIWASAKAVAISRLKI